MTLNSFTKIVWKLPWKWHQIISPLSGHHQAPAYKLKPFIHLEKKLNNTQKSNASSSWSAKFLCFDICVEPARIFFINVKSLRLVQIWTRSIEPRFICYLKFKTITHYSGTIFIAEKCEKSSHSIYIMEKQCWCKKNPIFQNIVFKIWSKSPHRNILSTRFLLKFRKK